MDDDTGPRWRSIAVAATVSLLLMLLGWVLLARAQREPAAEPTPAPAPAPAPVGPPTAEKASSPPAALPNLAGRVLLAGCRQGECGWVRVVRLESVSATPRGELRRITLRRGLSTDSGDSPDPANVEWEAADRADYVFCSAERPAYAFPGDEGGYLIHYLDLFALAGYNMSTAGLYVRFCHDREFDFEDEAAVRALGYRPATRNEQVENARPEDMAAF
jgi:hypothetical protein